MVCLENNPGVSSLTKLVEGLGVEVVASVQLTFGSLLEMSCCFKSMAAATGFAALWMPQLHVHVDSPATCTCSKAPGLLFMVGQSRK